MTKRDKYLQKTYGITEERYNEMLKEQNNACALCLRHKSNFKYNLHVEHNHKSGKIRSLCCFYCNKIRIGRNDLASAEALYDYMSKYDG